MVAQGADPAAPSKALHCEQVMGVPRIRKDPGFQPTLSPNEIGSHVRSDPLEGLSQRQGWIEMPTSPSP